MGVEVGAAAEAAPPPTPPPIVVRTTASCNSSVAPGRMALAMRASTERSWGRAGTGAMVVSWTAAYADGGRSTVVGGWGGRGVVIRVVVVVRVVVIRVVVVAVTVVVVVRVVAVVRVVVVVRVSDHIHHRMEPTGHDTIQHFQVHFPRGCCCCCCCWTSIIRDTVGSGSDHGVRGFRLEELVGSVAVVGNQEERAVGDDGDGSIGRCHLCCFLVGEAGRGERKRMNDRSRSMDRRMTEEYP